MKKVKFFFILLGMFLLSTVSNAELTGDICDLSDRSDSFSTADTRTYDGNVTNGSMETFYFQILRAGTLVLTPDSDGNKAKMAVSDNSCPADASEYVPVTISVTEPTDINVLIKGTNTAVYTLTAKFTPYPIGLFKTNFPPQVKANIPTNVTYTLTAVNYDEDPISVTIKDTLPSEVTTTLSIHTDADGLDCNKTTLICTGSLDGGEIAEIIIDVTVHPTDTDDVINTAIMTNDANTSNKVSATSTLLSVDATAAVDLDIQKYAEADTIPPGTDFIYAVFVTNHTQGKYAELVTVTDLFPNDDDNVTIVSYNRGSGWDCDIQVGTNEDFTCYFDRPMGHEITYFTVTAHTNEGNYTTTATNVVTVDADNPLVTPTDHNHTWTNTITITDVNLTGGGVIGSQYIKGGPVEVLDNGLSLGDSLGTNRSDVYLQTKVASTQGMTIGTYIVNNLEEVDQYQDVTTIYGNNKLVPLTVILKLGNNNCYLLDEPHLTHDPDHKVVAIFEGADASKNAEDSSALDSGAFDLRNLGIKRARIIMQYIDINAKLEDANESCKVSSIDGNIKGLPQCLTNAAGSNKFDNNKYINTFGIEAFVRCAVKNGQPCESSHGGYGDDPYDSDYGCYECTLGGSGSCSEDNFAIRPDRFYADISSGDIYKAGKEYVFNFKGLTALGEPTTDYNETEDTLTDGTTFTIDLNVTNSSDCEVKELKLNPSVAFKDGWDDQNHSFSDIGDINMSMHETNETEFAKVDVDDTPIEDRLITEYNRTFIFRVIPDHFNIDANLTDHNKNYNFTYLHDINQYESDDNYSMAAALTIDIKAMGADNNITRNYMETCYAQDTNITLTLGGTNITYPGDQPLEYFLYFNPVEYNSTISNSGEGNDSLPTPVDKNITITSLDINNTVASFPADAPDGNGTTHIEYKLNFDRKQNLVVNPFKIDLSDVSIIDVDDVNGSDNVDQNATLYYARTRASMFFYEDIREASVKTPILVDVYCDFIPTSGCDILDNIDTYSGKIDEKYWWLSLGHNEDNGDGNITLEEGDIIEGNSSNWSVTHDVTIISNSKDENITVHQGTTNLDLPLTVIIDLDESSPTDTNHWLIYNPNSDIIALSPFYKVRFIGDAKWTGEGQTGYVMDINASYIKLQRLDW